MWQELTDEQKEQYKDFCDKHFGQTNTFSEDNEPLYFDEDMILINPAQIIEFLFPNPS